MDLVVLAIAIAGLLTLLWIAYCIRGIGRQLYIANAIEAEKAKMSGKPLPDL